MASKIEIVRCKLNKYKTPLFSFDRRGVYVRCKDCRELRDGEYKRGVYHLIPWSTIMMMMLDMWDPAKEETFGTIAQGSEGDSRYHEGSGGDNRSGRSGDSGSELDGEADQVSDVPSVASADNA